MKISAYILGNLGLSVWLGLGSFGVKVVCAQSGALTTRDPDGKVLVQRQSPGAYLGAYLGDAAHARGAVVGKVMPDSPAAKAGLLERDVLIGFAAAKIENAAQVYQWLNRSAANQSVALRVRRNETALTLNAVLGERRAKSDDPCQKLFGETNALLAEAKRLKALTDEAVNQGDAKLAEERQQEADSFFKQAEISRLDIEKAIAEGRTGVVGRQDGCLPAMLQPKTDSFGAAVVPLTPQLAHHYGVLSGGVLVMEVKAHSLAEQAGLKVGDCLVSLNEQPVINANELKLAFEMVEEKQAFSLTIVRAGQSQTLQVARQ